MQFKIVRIICGGFIKLKHQKNRKDDKILNLQM